MTIAEAPIQSAEFSAVRYHVPLDVAFPSKLGFSICRIAPGLEIRECNEDDRRLLKKVNEQSRSMIDLMHVVPIQHASHVICIDEQAYGPHVAEKILSELKRPIKPFALAFNASDIFKMIVVSLNLFQLFQLYATPYFITERLDINHVYPTRLDIGTEITTDTWQRYGDLSGYDITCGGVITCDDITNAVNILEKYYRFDGWIGNRVAVALHNFWNALFVTDSTLAFVALVSILETFTNLSSDRNDLVMNQIRRNVPKLVPLDAHGRAVTGERIDKIYETRSEIAHGSFAHRGHGVVTWTVTHIDAKSAHVDVSLSSDLMTIAVKMLHRVIFDQTLLSIIEDANTRDRERRAIRSYVDALPATEGMP